MDKELFGNFVAQLRKEKGMTQKELAQKLLVSDKAVSKWERGLSLPDVSLLRPLADALDVTVTELLEGKRMESREPKSPEQVEELVKRAVGMGQQPFWSQARMGRVLVFLGAFALVVLERLGIFFWADRNNLQGITLNVLEGLTVGFGFYFWVMMEEKLPEYYDKYKVRGYNDGFLRINMPGVSFNNANWPRVCKCLRIWSLVTMLTLPLLSLVIPQDSLPLQMAVLALFLGSLFLPICWVGRDPELGKGKKYPLIVLAVLIAVLVLLPGKENSYSTLQIGYFSSGGSGSWSARYSLFSGTKTKTLYPREDGYKITVNTEAGEISITIFDGSGLVFSEENMETGTHTVTLDGPSKVTIQANGHKGSFAITPEGAATSLP